MAEPTEKYTVLRAICMAGERVEVGDTVELTAVQYAELAHAGKVGPLVEKKRKGGSKQQPAEKPADEASGAAGEDPQAAGEGTNPEGAAA